MIRVARLAQGMLPLIAAAILSTVVPPVGTSAAADAGAPPGVAGQSVAPAVPAAGAKPSAEVPKPTPAAGAPNLSPSAPTPKRAPLNLEPLPARSDTGMLGKKIMGPDGKELGLLVNVLVDTRGRPQAAVIDFGGFLGVGSRKIAVDWRLLKLSPGQPDWKISLNLDRDEIQAAPEYKPDEASDMMVGPPKAAPSPEPDK
jgi:hypothetical protein